MRANPGHTTPASAAAGRAGGEPAGRKNWSVPPILIVFLLLTTVATLIVRTQESVLTDPGRRIMSAGQKARAQLSNQFAQMRQFIPTRSDDQPTANDTAAGDLWTRIQGRNDNQLAHSDHNVTPGAAIPRRHSDQRTAHSNNGTTVAAVTVAAIATQLTERNTKEGSSTAGAGKGGGDSMVVNPPKGVMCDVLVNMFTTFIDQSKDQRKISAQTAVLKAYQRLRAHGVQAWLFTESDDWAHKAEVHGVIAVRKFESNKHGTPLLSYMYKHVAATTDSQCGPPKQMVFDSYANGDIVFTMGLVDTLTEIRRGWAREVAAGARKGVLVVGKRTNVEYHKQEFVTDKDVSDFAKKGTLFQNDAEDYFLYTRGSPRSWDLMPNFVVGRRAYDNWLVDNSYHDRGMDLIDATNTILAMHLTAADGNKAGHKKGLDNNHNINAFNPVTNKSVGPHEWNDGRTDNAHFFTKHHSGKIAFVVRGNMAVGRTLPAALSTKRRFVRR